MTRSFLAASLSILSLAAVGCGEPAPMVDAGPGADAPAPLDAPRMPDAREPTDAPRAPDAPAPRCEGPECRVVELALGFETSCARRQNGEVWCWGRGQSGELGDGASRHLPGCTRPGDKEPTDCSDTAVRVDLPTPAVRVYAQGGFDFCAEDAAGEFRCWGSRGYVISGEEEEDRLRPEVAPTFRGARSFANSFISTCWLDGDGTPTCIGSNGVGQLAQGDFMMRVTPVQPLLEGSGTPVPLEGLREIASSTTFGGTFCARSADQLYCWGQNDLGQIGDPAMHTICVSGIREFDCAPFATPVAFARTADIARLSLGSQHTCALLTDGTAWCWGQNNNGELALGAAGTQDVVARREPTEVTNLTDVAEIELGARHSCARRNDGSVWCWGSNDLGQLGDGMTDHPEAQCMSGSSLIDCSSVPVQVTGIDDAIELDVGRQHSCVIRMDGSVWCWGNNDAYEAGPGDRLPIGTPSRIPSL